MFADRKDAGRRLGRALRKYRSRQPLVLAIPRGGAEVGFEAAKALGAEFSLVICRKLPFPDNPEAGFGAVAEDGSVFLPKPTGLDPALIRRIIREQKKEIIRRIAVLRKNRPLPALAGRLVILVDDGIAAGSTMRSALMLCRNREAAGVVVAAPVSGAAQLPALAAAADDVVILETPAYFQAVAQVYRRWYDVSDEEVLRIMETPAKPVMERKNA